VVNDGLLLGYNASRVSTTGVEGAGSVFEVDGIINYVVWQVLLEPMTI
jgi:hypothetical protein